MATVDPIAPAEALPESLLTEARKLEPVIENLLNRIRDVLIENPPVRVEPAESASPDFDDLRGELLGIVHHLQCADQVLYDLQNVPLELQPASIVVHRATTELDGLYNRLDEWSVRHQHVPKPLATEEEISARNVAMLAAVEPCGSDATADRLRAYLASMRTTRDVVYPGETEDRIQRGRSLIERLALSAHGTDAPELRLTAAQCADVLAYMSGAEPVDMGNWWNEPAGGTSHVCGFIMILDALEESLRGEEAEEPAPGAELPQALKDHLQEQQTRMAELLSLLERLDEDADQMYTRIAVREAKELEMALDSITLDKVLKAGETARQ